MVVQIPQGSRVKIQAVDPTQGVDRISYRVDRITDTPFPAAYGFIHGTRGPDGDPLDAFIIGRQQFHTGDTLELGSLIHLGTIDMMDDGESDPKELYFLGKDLATDIKFVVQKIGQILVHLKTYKLRVESGRLIQGRIEIEGLRLSPKVAGFIQGTRVLPYEVHP